MSISLVLEGITAELAAEISSSLHVPTIGIGAGVGCDGQVLVCFDLLGMNPTFKPKFVKQYAKLHEEITAAMQAFAEEVRAGAFPGEEHRFRSETLRLVDADGSGDNEAPDKIYGVPV